MPRCTVIQTPPCCDAISSYSAARAALQRSIRHQTDCSCLPAATPQVRPIDAADFATAAAAIKPSVGREQLRRFEAWTKEYGMAA